MVKSSRNLKPQAAIDAELLAETQKTARESNSASIASAVRAVIGAYVTSENATAKAKAAWEGALESQRTKLEDTYVALAKLSHEHEMTPDMIRDTLHAALVHFYGEDKAKSGVGTVAKLRAQLARAMHPKVRAALPTIIQPWIDAWEGETAAIAAERATAEAEGRTVKPVATPIRDKFDNRGGTVTQALQLARGSEAKLNAKGDKVITPAVPSVVATKPAEVLAWVSANPRVSRAPAVPVAGVPDALPKDATPREIATARVTGLINAVQDVAKDYPAATALFANVLTALRLCTGDKLLPSTLAEQAANKPLIPPAEPIAGAADLDAAVDPDIAEFRAFQAFQAMKAKAGK